MRFTGLFPCSLLPKTYNESTSLSDHSQLIGQRQHYHKHALALKSTTIPNIKSNLSSYHTVHL
ncbi:MAG: hypothetical protein F6K53_30205 [Moorea sp. SIO4A1]|uniref:hypothetical protein n=1 Tax=Moorena sp. SIO4A1 TaxID=2607835 RepID=UPI00145083FC|nr:hypothetical protein [Moorena sp. SIO4A1]NEQ61470.1 hypothetical protein [Moorena sp. SIO4A1]